MGQTHTSMLHVKFINFNINIKIFFIFLSKSAYLTSHTMFTGDGLTTYIFVNRKILKPKFIDPAFILIYTNFFPIMIVIINECLRWS